MLLTKAESERMAKEAQYKEIKARGSDATILSGNLLIQQLRKDKITQEAKVASLNRIYGKNYPQIQTEQANLKELSARLDNEVKRVRNSVEGDYRAARKTENLVREALQAHKAKVGDLQNNLVKYHILKRDMMANETLYQALLGRMKETSIASTMVASNVAVIAPAELPIKPYKPKKKLNILVAGFVGLMAGIGLAFVVEHFDDSIKTAEEMSRVCKLPILGVVPLVIPEDKEGVDRKAMAMVTINQPKSMVTEAIRNIHTSVMLSGSGTRRNLWLSLVLTPVKGKVPSLSTWQFRWP